MGVTNILNQVDGERIYEHVLKLQGTRHLIDAPRELSEAADYLHSEFERYGLVSREQTFRVPSFKGTFRNIEGAIEQGDDAELLVVAHYDSVENCPGANDNASGVAVMLETARVLALRGVGNVRFIGFSLEELNPSYALRSRQLAQSLGLKDSQNRYTSLHVHTNMKKLLELQRKYSALGKGPADAMAAARTEIEAQMSEAESAYAKRLEEMYEGITPTSWPGKTGTMGSAFWVEEAIRSNKNIMGVLCFDTIGYTSDKEYSQASPAGMKPEMFQTSKLSNLTTGNFVVALGDINSGKLIQSFLAQTELDSSGLPCAALQIPFDYEQIANSMRDVLRSDHAPFWRQGIPALHITDTAEFRYPYYHTPADTIDKLDFSFMTKICRATVATALDLTGR